MGGRLIGNGSANSSTVASPSASRRTIERRVGSDNAAKTASNRSGAITAIVAVPPADTSQVSYLTETLNIVKPESVPHLGRTRHTLRSVRPSRDAIRARGWANPAHRHSGPREPATSRGGARTGPNRRRDALRRQPPN